MHHFTTRRGCCNSCDSLSSVVSCTSAVLYTQTSSKVWRKTRSREPIREQERHQVIPGDMLTRCLCVTMATEGVLQQGEERGCVFINEFLLYLKCK